VDLLTQDLFIRVTDSFSCYEVLTCLCTFKYIQKTFYRAPNGRFYEISPVYRFSVHVVGFNLTWCMGLKLAILYEI